MKVKVSFSGFKTPAGAFAICGLHGLPVWLYGMNKHMWSPFMSHHLQLGVTGILVSGRALCMGVEVRVVATDNNTSHRSFVDKLRNWSTGQLVDWLTDQPNGWAINVWPTEYWLSDWMTEQPINWPINWITDLLIRWPAFWPIDWLTDCPADQLTDWLNGWLTPSLTDLLTDLPTNRLTD